MIKYLETQNNIASVKEYLCNEKKKCLEDKLQEFKKYVIETSGKAYEKLKPNPKVYPSGN